jgi:hypothetical protein
MSLLSERILTRAGKAGVRRAKPNIPSRTLRRACIYVPLDTTLSSSRGRIYIPHYWARFVHDGRGPVSPKTKKVLIWYRNPSQDPRLKGSKGRSPERFSSRPRLNISKAELRKGIKSGKIIARLYAGPMTGRPFFGNQPGEGMYGFKAEVSQIAREEISRIMREFTKEPNARERQVSIASVTL